MVHFQLLLGKSSLGATSIANMFCFFLIAAASTIWQSTSWGEKIHTAHVRHTPFGEAFLWRIRISKVAHEQIADTSGWSGPRVLLFHWPVCVCVCSWGAVITLDTPHCFSLRRTLFVEHFQFSCFYFSERGREVRERIGLVRGTTGTGTVLFKNKSRQSTRWSVPQTKTRKRTPDEKVLREKYCGLMSSRELFAVQISFVADSVLNTRALLPTWHVSARRSVLVCSRSGGCESVENFAKSESTGG